VLTEIQEQLETCHTFTFNVAFITEDGIAMLKTQLADLSRKGVHGRLIISPYLDFNEPDVLRGLLKFDNIEVRMTKKREEHVCEGILLREGARKCCHCRKFKFNRSSLEIKL